MKQSGADPGKNRPILTLKINTISVGQESVVTASAAGAAGLRQSTQLQTGLTTTSQHSPPEN